METFSPPDHQYASVLQLDTSVPEPSGIEMRRRGEGGFRRIVQLAAIKGNVSPSAEMLPERWIPIPITRVSSGYQYRS